MAEIIVNSMHKTVETVNGKPRHAVTATFTNLDGDTETKTWYFGYKKQAEATTEEDIRNLLLEEADTV